METGLDMGNQTIFNVKDPTISDHGVNKKYADATFLKLSGGTMSGAINMGGGKVENLGTPTANTDAATKKYVDDEAAKLLPLSGGAMTSPLIMDGEKITNLSDPSSSSEPETKRYVDQSHLSQSGIQKNEFLYLMQDVNESSSESNITVLGIKKFPQTPHSLNKNAYKFTMKKLAQDKYASRIGFNVYQLPAGAYTFVVEFFPPSLNNVSIDCRSTSINVNHQTM